MTEAENKLLVHLSSFAVEYSAIFFVSKVSEDTDFLIFGIGPKSPKGKMAAMCLPQAGSIIAPEKLNLITK